MHAPPACSFPCFKVSSDTIRHVAPLLICKIDFPSLHLLSPCDRGREAESL